MKTVSVSEARWSALSRQVAKGREVIISRRSKPFAKVTPIPQPEEKMGIHEVMERLFALRATIKPLPKGETTKDLINAGRRI
ncbi:MAG: type II toxin-antitoxin system Phd/YefM family antitoxin [Verrucomicrobiales bacterium]|nr:type II toxin-antitoxin system Phd/YefM family antitoxin [Verrucomicrobiales bacterium]